jgi:hypothetical protein
MAPCPLKVASRRAMIDRKLAIFSRAVLRPSSSIHSRAASSSSSVISSSRCAMCGVSSIIVRTAPAETAQLQIGRRGHVIGGRFAVRTAHEIRRQQQAHHLPAPVLHRLGQRGDTAHDRGHEIHRVTRPDDRLPGFVTPVIFDSLKFFEFIGFAARADRAMADRAVRTFRLREGELFVSALRRPPSKAADPS